MGSEKPSSDAVKAAEALQTLGKNAFDFEHARYDAAETKTGRYLTVLGLVLAAAAIKAEDLLWTIAHTTMRWPWRVSFAVAYVTVFVSAFCAVLLALRTMRVEDVPALPLDDELQNLFRQHPFATAVDKMADAYFTETKTFRETNERRCKDLNRIYWLMNIIVVSATASLVLYLPLRLHTPDKEPTSGGITTMAKPTTNPTPSTQPSPSTTPAAPAQPPKFDTVKKGDPSPRETKVK